jgi:hypothetical protein
VGTTFEPKTKAQCQSNEVFSASRGLCEPCNAACSTCSGKGLSDCTTCRVGKKDAHGLCPPVITEYVGAETVFELILF